MLNRLKQLLVGRRGGLNGLPSAVLQEWAQRHQLEHSTLPNGGFVLSGRLAGQSMQLRWEPSLRFYLNGLELLARVDLERAPTGQVVVLERTLKHVFEQQANALYDSSVDSLRTEALSLPEEVRWLTQFRDAGWQGPDTGFWARYAVLTDTPELARKWLEPPIIEALRVLAAERSADTPLVFTLLRGKAGLCVQVDTEDDGADGMRALELLERLTLRALALADGRDARG